MWLVWSDVTPVLPNHILPPIVKSLKSPRTSMKLPKCAIIILWNPSGCRVASAAAPPGTSPPALHRGRPGPRSCQSSARTMRCSRAWPRKCPLRTKKACQVLLSGAVRHEFMCFALSTVRLEYQSSRRRRWWRRRRRNWLGFSRTHFWLY